MPEEDEASMNWESNFHEAYWHQKLSGMSNKDMRYLSVVRFRVISELLPSSFNSLLDIGCGDGTTLRLVEKETRVRGIGVDVSQTSIQRALKLGVDALVHDAEKPFPFEDSRFDLVICSEVLEHLRFPHICLSEMKRMLKQNGVLILSIPNLGFVRRRLRLLLGRNPFDNQEYHLAEHLHHWTNRSFRTMLMDFGFSVVRMLPIKSHGIKNRLVSAWPSMFSDYLFYLVKKRTGMRTDLRCSMNKTIQAELAKMRELSAKETAEGKQ